MAAKLNSRQEKFANNLAMGMTKAKAYAEAGYKPDPGNPTRLTENDRVQKRLAELQERAALRTGITIENLTADLLRVVEEADLLEKTPGALNAKRAALMDIATLNGLVVARSETGKPGDFSIADRIVARWKANRTKLDA
jgi:phage terminase small subunit